MKLEDFFLSEKFGFLLPDPLHILPEYFQQWNDLAQNLSMLIQRKELRAIVDEMPVLDYTILKGYRQYTLAHLQLSMITAGYIILDGFNNVPDVLPESLAVPLYRISQELGIPPIFCHPDGGLSNWKLTDRNSPPDLENLRCIYNFPGGMDSNYFFMIVVRTELDFAPAIKCIIDGMEASDKDDVETLIQNLSMIRQAVLNMKNTLKNLHKLVSPEVFYDILRPYFWGWGYDVAPGSPYPDGLIFEGISDKRIKLRGSSAAQSSTLQCLDAAFGIRHQPSDREFMLEMRNYLPLAHKKFIEEIESKSNIRNYVLESGHLILKKTFDEVLSAIADFRSYHIQIVTKYIIIMSRRDIQTDHTVVMAGTSGSNLLPFLKRLRQTTNDEKVASDN